MSENYHKAYDEDAPLVAAWRRGELSSFESLVRKHQKRMLNVAFRIIGDYHDACEVVQDAFVSAYRGIDSFRGAARFSTWLTSIAINLSRNRLQQAKTKRKNEAFSLDEKGGVEHNGRQQERPSTAPSALDRLERMSVHEKLQECMKGLSVDFREAIVLRDVEEYSYDEISAILQVSEGTVKSRLFRARELVKDCLKRAVGEI